MTENNINDTIQKFNDSFKSIFELTTRMDERVNQHSGNIIKLEVLFSSVSEKLGEINTKLALLEDKTSKSIAKDIDDLEQQLSDLSRAVGELSGKLSKVQTISEKSESRWDGILRFAVQILWVVVASYLLFKLNLNPPAVP